MVQDNKWGHFFMRAITVMFTVIIAVLTFMSFFEHCKANINIYEQPRNIEQHQPVLYIGLAIAGTVLLLVVCHFISVLLSKSKEGWKIVYKILLIGGIIICGASIFWIMFNDAVPRYDQHILFREARIMVGYEEGEYDFSNFELLPRNKGLTLVMAVMLRLLGDSQISFRILNVIGAIVLLVSVSLTTKKIWKERSVTIATILFLVTYYPIIIYTSYIYGTLLSAAFGALGIYAIVSFCENNRLKYLVIAAFSFPFAIQMHQSAAIVMIAAMFYMVLHITKKNVGQTVIYFIILLAMVFSFNKIADATYQKITGAQLGEAVPTLAYIYMGLSAEEGLGGPGSQDGSYCEIFFENNNDPKATNRDAINRIMKIFSEYLRGERDPEFFVDKIKFQWLDPTFGARKTIEINHETAGEPANSEAYIRFYHSSLRDIGFKIAVVGMIIVYSLNLFAAIYQIYRKQYNKLHFYIQILLIGGFVFQMMWESMSRYCFSYFIWLIPEAAYGLVLLYKVVMNIVEKTNGSKTIGIKS